MIKKIAITGAAAGILLSSVVPAFAGRDYRGDRDSQSKIEISNDDVNVSSGALTIANTGLNMVDGNMMPQMNFRDKHHSSNEGGYIFTGDAGASATVLNDVNYNQIDPCGGVCRDRNGGVDIEIDNDDTNVRTGVATVANTGANMVRGQGMIMTGAAGASSVVTSLVNTNIIGGSN